MILLLALSQSDELDSVGLSSRIKNGDHAAFKRFFDLHFDPLMGYLLSRGMNRVTAEELTQNAFIKIWENRDKIDETKSLRAYLFRIAYTRMLNHVRDHAKFVSKQPEQQTAGTDNPEQNLREKELVDQIEKAVANMPEKRRLVFESCFLQEFTYRETANMMDISIKTVENHMALALKDIRKELQLFNE